MGHKSKPDVVVGKVPSRNHRLLLQLLLLCCVFLVIRKSSKLLPPFARFFFPGVGIGVASFLSFGTTAFSDPAAHVLLFRYYR